MCFSFVWSEKNADEYLISNGGIHCDSSFYHQWVQSQTLVFIFLREKMQLEFHWLFTFYTVHCTLYYLTDIHRVLCMLCSIIGTSEHKRHSKHLRPALYSKDYSKDKWSTFCSNVGLVASYKIISLTVLLFLHIANWISKTTVKTKLRALSSVFKVAVTVRWDRWQATTEKKHSALWEWQLTTIVDGKQRRRDRNTKMLHDIVLHRHRTLHCNLPRFVSSFFVYTYKYRIEFKFQSWTRRIQLKYMYTYAIR